MDDVKCIFIGRPEECGLCLETIKIRCLQNKKHLLLTAQGKKDVVREVKKMANHPDRYKTKAGQEQRAGG